MEDLPATAAQINPLVDAVLLAPGMLRHCGIFAGTKRPLAVVRLNWNTVYCFKFGYTARRAFSPMIRWTPSAKAWISPWSR